MMRMVAVLMVISLVIASAATARAEEFETSAKFAYMLDVNTGAVLLDKGSTERMTPSSMTKLMTLYLLFDAMKKGSVTPETTFPVSERAWRMQGSKMFVQAGDSVAVKELIPGIIVQSGNDACVVVAEGIAGSQEAFADDMNAMAEKLGLKDSHFMNPDGWPDPKHYMTAHDLALLARHIIEDFPEYYPHFKETDFTYNNIHQPNRNRLLYRNIGVDGLKTGHTEDGGYGITASAVEDGRRIILVVNGLATEKERIEEAERLLHHGFRDFTTVKLYKAGDPIEKAEVWMGTEKDVPLVTAEDIGYTASKRIGQKDTAEMSVTWQSPVVAPVHKGDKLAELTIKRNGEVFKTLPLVAGADVPRLSFFGRMKAIPLHYLSGKKE